MVQVAKALGAKAVVGIDIDAGKLTKRVVLTPDF
jgi:uncharacterized protein YbjQ (UPF0145 family)